MYCADGAETVGLQDGTIKYEIKLTGELSTNVLSLGEEAPEYGTLVMEGVNAQHHQHMFCARLDMAVDDEEGGKGLYVTEVTTCFERCYALHAVLKQGKGLYVTKVSTCLEICYDVHAVLKWHGEAGRGLYVSEGMTCFVMCCAVHAVLKQACPVLCTRPGAGTFIRA